MATAGRRPKAVERVESSFFSSFYVRLSLVGVIIIGGATLIGRSDSGQINVASTIQSSNDAAVEAGGNPIDNVATTPESLRNMPNGGLVAAEGGEPEVTPETEPVPVAEETTASTTEGTTGTDAEATDETHEDNSGVSPTE